MTYEDAYILAKYNRYENATFWMKRYYDLQEGRFWLGMIVMGGSVICCMAMGWL